MIFMSEQSATRNAAASVKELHQEAPSCGVIMPISETANHVEAHWQAVQTLLHRAINAAGFSPRNVWESTATDRISERIIGNIFQVPIVVADITDLNPNVMLELGLRLSSKKPTVVVATTGSDIPFDIRDFHAVFYPADMNMLGMEEFFRKLTRVLQEKYRAFTGDAYVPFLGNVIVDVASPETREVGANEIILSRLDDIAARLGTMEAASRAPKGNLSSFRIRPASSPANGTSTVRIPDEGVAAFVSSAHGLLEVDSIREKSSDAGFTELDVNWSGAESFIAIDNKLSEIANRFGGDTDIPF
jgi:hypothetical protein